MDVFVHRNHLAPGAVHRRGCEAREVGHRGVRHEPAAEALDMAVGVVLARFQGDDT